MDVDLRRSIPSQESDECIIDERGIGRSGMRRTRLSEEGMVDGSCSHGFGPWHDYATDVPRRHPAPPRSEVLASELTRP